MQIVNQYLENNKAKIGQAFTASCKKNELPATSLHAFLRAIFDIEAIRFIREGRDYFREDDNQSYTDKVIQKYYKTTPDGKKGKFYLYRITFTFEEIQEYLQFWISTDKTLTVHPPPAPIQEVQPVPSPPILQQPTHETVQVHASADPLPEIKEVGVLGESAFLDNQFILDEHKIPLLLQGYQSQITKLEQKLSNPGINASESAAISGAIDIYKKKIEDLQSKKPLHHHSQQKNVSPPKSKTEASPTRKEANLKALFQFYARQNHLTGVKASFERIEHQSQTINYQKLVHFLKQHQIFPEKPKDQKRLHNLYVRVCSNTRDLHFSDFMQLLEKLPDILYESQEGARQKMMEKIQANSHKMGKVQPSDKGKMHNPFHSLQKNNFRIDSQNLKYSFKLKPLQGKLQEEVNSQLQARRRLKQLAKVEMNRQKEARQMQQLKKLMAVDPFHPLVLKHADLLHKRSSSVLMQPIASLDNMQKFRDASFDIRAQFGINLDDDPLNHLENAKHASGRYDSRADQIEREESQRMEVLMSGLLQRSEAKVEKFSQSPRKRQVSSKLA